MSHCDTPSPLATYRTLATTPTWLTTARRRLANSFSVTAHCDGACSGNPGPGGWAAVIDCPTAGRVELFGSARHTTSNRQELTAAIVALAVLPAGCKALVRSDSTYVVNGASRFAERRLKRMARGAAVPNADLWERLDAEQASRTVRWQWIKGHSGYAENELADQLATRAAREARAAA